MTVSVFFLQAPGQFVPSSGLAPPAPSAAKECAPPWNQRGGITRLRVMGPGEPIRAIGEKAWHSGYVILFVGDAISLMSHVSSRSKNKLLVDKFAQKGICWIFSDTRLVVRKYLYSIPYFFLSNMYKPE
jgi:hypothetical protein